MIDGNAENGPEAASPAPGCACPQQIGEFCQKRLEGVKFSDFPKDCRKHPWHRRRWSGEIPRPWLSIARRTVSGGVHRQPSIYCLCKLRRQSAQAVGAWRSNARRRRLEDGRCCSHGPNYRQRPVGRPRHRSAAACANSRPYGRVLRRGRRWAIRIQCSKAPSCRRMRTRVHAACPIAPTCDGLQERRIPNRWNYWCMDARRRRPGNHPVFVRIGKATSCSRWNQFRSCPEYRTAGPTARRRRHAALLPCTDTCWHRCLRCQVHVLQPNLPFPFRRLLNNGHKQMKRQPDRSADNAPDAHTRSAMCRAALSAKSMA